MKKHLNKINLKRFISACLTFTIAVTSIPFSVNAAEFTDVTESDWFYPYVTEMADKGFISGTSDTTYEPTSLLSMAAFSTMIARVFYGITASEELETSTGDWWMPYLTACLNRGGLVGTIAENPDNWDDVAGVSITRYDMSMMIFNLLSDREITELSGDEISETLSQITDNIEDNYINSVVTAFYHGFLSGREDGSFDGEAFLTRGEAAVVLSKLVNTTLIEIEPVAELLEREHPEGERPEGMPPEGELPPEGERPEGMPPEGMPPEGELSPEGERPEGMLPEGELPPEGMRPEGMPPEGELPPPIE